MIWISLCALCAYLAYRAIKGGFERSQSERLNGYGIFAIVLFLVIILSWVSEHVF
jgi:hypothetical protein